MTASELVAPPGVAATDDYTVSPRPDHTTASADGGGWSASTGDRPPTAWPTAARLAVIWLGVVGSAYLVQAIRRARGRPTATPGRSASWQQGRARVRDATQVADITDEYLMTLIRDRDAEALATLYDRYRRVAFSLAYRILNDVGKAEDVLQESFLAIWRQAATYQPARGHPRGWVLTIVRNRAINALRRDRLAPGQLGELPDDLLDSNQPEIWQVAFETIRSDEVRAALARLPSEQRLVVDLAFFGGLSHAEISERLVVPLGTVKSRIRLAFGKLQSVLAGYAREPSA